MILFLLSVCILLLYVYFILFMLSFVPPTCNICNSTFFSFGVITFIHDYVFANKGRMAISVGTVVFI